MNPKLEIDAMVTRPHSRPTVALEANDAATAMAWRREMERAQIENWLSHGMVGSAGASLPAPMMPNDKVIAGTVLWPFVPPEAAATAATGSACAHARVSCAGESPGTKEYLVQEQAARLPVDRFADGAGSVQAHAASVASVRETPTEHRAPLSPDPEGPPAIAHARSRTELLASYLQSLGVIAITAAVEQGGAIDVANEPPAAARPTVPVVLDSSEVAAFAQVPISQPGKPAGYLIEAPMAGSVPVAPTTGTAVPIGTPPQGGPQVSVVDSARPENADLPEAGCERAGAWREPIRLHADWSAEGVRLWLGMDASQVASLHSITVQIQRWLSTHGLKLLTISCNGRIVVDNAGAQADSDAFQAETERDGRAAAPNAQIPILKEVP